MERVDIVRAGCENLLTDRKRLLKLARSGMPQGFGKGLTVPVLPAVYRT
jgi:hypothetical protein